MQASSDTSSLPEPSTQPSTHAADQASAKPSSLPVTIVGGYLGSGKTTLINHVLNNSSGRKYAVLVNDFGELAIDAQLIESKEGDVINLSGGCVCCSYGNDLISALMQLDTSTIDQVVIEASGVALPGAIAGSLSLLSEFKVALVVVLADGSTVKQQSTDRYIADTIDRQLVSADLVLINKTDLLDSLQVEQVKSWLQNSYPSARTVATRHAEYPVGLFLLDHPLNHIDRDTTSGNANSHTTSIYTTFTLEVNNKCDVNELAAKLADAEPGLLRVKGFARNLKGQMQLIQIVGKRWTVQPAPSGAKEGLVCIGLSSDKLSSESVSAILGSV